MNIKNQLFLISRKKPFFSGGQQGMDGRLEELVVKAVLSPQYLFLYQML